MKSPKALLLTGLAAYALFLLWQLPAQEAASLLAARGGNLPKARELTGSWRHGVGRHCTVGGVPVREIEWRFRPLALLGGRLAVTVSGQSERSTLAATVSRGMTALAAEALEGRVALAELNPIVRAFGLRLEGLLAASLAGVEIRKGRITAAHGKVVWNEAALDRRTPLGTLVALVTTDGDGVRVTVRDQGGPLRAEGSLLLSGDGGYTVTATVAAREAVAKEGLDRLAALGRLGDDGVLRIERSGQVPLLAWP